MVKLFMYMKVITGLSMSFLAELKQKVEKIRGWYNNMFDKFKNCEVELTPKEEKLFSAAIRWHANSHYRLELIIYFGLRIIINIRSSITI